MISLSRILSNTPLPVAPNFVFYQPTVGAILDMSDAMFWSLIKVWDVERKELIERETEETLKVDDFKLWSAVMVTNPLLRMRLTASIDCFLKTKVEFLELSNTIMVGEGEQRIAIDEDFWRNMRDICASITFYVMGKPDETEQYRETDKMSERERQLIAKMKKGAERLRKIKGEEQDPADQLAKQITSLAAIGHYTYDQVFNFTRIQLVCLLKKYVDIQQYELSTALSPYMDSKKSKPVQHWLNT